MIDLSLSLSFSEDLVKSYSVPDGTDFFFYYGIDYNFGFTRYKIIASTADAQFLGFSCSLD